MVFTLKNDALMFGFLTKEQVELEAIEQIAEFHPEIKEENMIEKHFVRAWSNQPSYQCAYAFLKARQFNTVR